MDRQTHRHTFLYLLQQFSISMSNTLNDSISLDFMLGKELIEVGISIAQVVLKFTDKLSILIENTYYVDYGKGLTLLEGGDMNNSKELTNFLGRSISSVQTIEDGQIMIMFDDQYYIHLLVDESGYESYYIEYNEVQIIG
jgi:translation initiation factor 1 (eIF-1/SUI1)